MKEVDAIATFDDILYWELPARYDICAYVFATDIGMRIDIGYWSGTIPAYGNYQI